MNKKFLLSVALVLGSFSMSNAQTEDSGEKHFVAVPHESYDENFGFGGKHSCVKTDFNCGWYHHNFPAGGFGPGYSLSYEYVFKPGVGVGLEYMAECGNKDNFRTHFLGPSFVYAKSYDSWTLNLSSGLGAGWIKYDSARMGKNTVDNLMGLFAQGEVQKRFSKHFGIAAGVRVICIFLFAMDKWEEEGAEPVTDGSASIRFTIGPRFYF